MFKNRLISVLCIAAMFSSLYITAEASEQYDSAFDRANSFLSAVNIMTVDGADTEKGISRGKFAYLLSKLMGISDDAPDSGTGEEGSKYEGNVFEQETDESWKWVDDSGASDNSETKLSGTCFYDVPSDYEYWEYIRPLAEFGIYTGTDGYFYPERMVTSNEAVKLMVTLLNADFLAEENYPDGYINAAARLDVLKNIPDYDGNARLTERNAAVLFYNALHTQVYIRTEDGNNVRMEQQDDYYMMTKAFDMNYVKAVITSDGITSIDGNDAPAKHIMAKGENYFLDGISSGGLLGKSVILYYVTNDYGDRSVKYIEEDKNKNRTVILDSEDIKGFSDGVLSYYDGGKEKKADITNSTAVIYNGKRTDSYTAECFDIADGQIVLIDNNNDGRYETAKITKMRTLVAGAVDTDRKIIYDKFENGLTAEFNGTDDTVCDGNGAEVEFKNINAGNVVSVAESLDGERKTAIISSRSVTGTYRSSDAGNGTITVDDKIYKLSYRAKLPSAMGDYRVYLDCNGKAVWFESEKVCRYGYLIKMYSMDNPDTYQARIFGADGEFYRYNLGERLKLNNRSTKAEDAVKVFSGKDGELIQYSTKNDIITEILQCGADEERFVKGYDNADGTEATYRNISGKYSGFFSDRPVAYTDADTVIMNIPSKDTGNENLYFIKKGSHDDKMIINQVYYPGKNTAAADVIISFSEDSSSGNITPGAGSKAAAISKISSTEFENGDSGYIVECYIEGKQTVLNCIKEDVFPIIESLKIGDLAAFSKDSLGNISAAAKLFDASNKRMESGVHLLVNEKNTEFETNIMQREKDKSSYIAMFRAIHGTVLHKYDDSGYYDIVPYIYENGENTGETDDTDKWALKIPAASVMVYDSGARGEKLRQGNYNDIIDYNSSDIKTDIVVHLFWGTVTQAVIYR